MGISFDYYSISLLLGGFIALLSGLVVFIHNHKKIENIAWFFLNIASAVWSFGYFITITATQKEVALVSDLVLHLAAILIPLFYLFFVVSMTDSLKKNRVKIIIATIAGFLFLISAPTKLFVRDVMPKAFFNFVPDAGPFYIYFTAYFFVLVLYALYILFRKYLESADLVEKNRYKYMILFTVAGFSGGGSVFFLTFNIPILPYPIILFSLYPIISGYAIFRYQLFDVKVIATEVLVFILWIFILIRALLSESLFDRFINGGLFFFIVATGIFLIRSVLKEVRAREEIEELATKLEFANLRLKQLDEAKSDFLSIASHQLRTPLTAIKGYASMILEGSYGKISATTKSAVDKIFQSSQRLVLIIGDFLDISHIEQGTMQYDFAALDVRELAKGLTDEFKATIESSTDKSKALKISFEADEKENFSVNADRNKIRQVVSNLIDNSIKYTPAGFVKVSLSKIAENGNVLLKIEDSGIGISAETMPNLFKKFGRARSLSSAYANGSGLGLYVAKEIIKAHKGKIWAESEGEGKGSRFFVELPEK